MQVHTPNTSSIRTQSIKYILGASDFVHSSVRAQVPLTAHLVNFGFLPLDSSSVSYSNAEFPHIMRCKPHSYGAQSIPPGNLHSTRLPVRASLRNTTTSCSALRMYPGTWYQYVLCLAIISNPNVDGRRPAERPLTTALRVVQVPSSPELPRNTDTSTIY